MTPTAFYLLTCAGFGLLIGGFVGYFFGLQSGYKWGATDAANACQRILDETTPEELRKAGAV